MSDPNPCCPTTRRTWLARSVGLLGLTGLVGSATAAGEPIVVHHIGPFTGVLAASNTEAIEGARLALEAFNKRGGLAGRPVQLKTLDDAQDAKRSAVLLDELLAEGKLLALMMPRTTPSLEAMMPAIAARGVPVVGPQTGASFVNQPPKREIFTLRASYQKEAERAIRLQHSVGVRKFGLVLADDAFGRDTRIGIDKALAELQIEPVAVARMDNRKADMAEPVNLLLAKQPQVVLLICSAKAAAEFIKGYRAAGALKRMAKEYGSERLEAACSRALDIGASSLTSVRSILSTGLDRQKAPESDIQEATFHHANVRGSGYYH